MASENRTADERQTWALEKIHDRTEATPDGVQNEESELWTSTQRLKADASKTDLLERADVGPLVDGLVATGDLVLWHGLVAPATDEHLKAIVQNEVEAEVTRTALVGLCNTIQQGEPVEPTADQGDGIATDGGAPDPDAFRIPTVDELDAMRVDRGLSQKELSRRAGKESDRFNTILHRDMDPQTETMRAFLSALQEAEARTDDEIGRTGPKPQRSALSEDPAGEESARDPQELERMSSKLAHTPADHVGEDPRPPDEQDTPMTDGGRSDPTALYQRALDTWGVDAQLLKGVEECSELAGELARAVNGLGDDDNLLDELADVEVMVEQLSLVLGDGRVDAAREEKLDRLERRLDEAEEVAHVQ